MDGGVEAFWVDALHELEALDGGGGDGGPVYGAGVVHQDVQTMVGLVVDGRTWGSAWLNSLYNKGKMGE